MNPPTLRELQRWMKARIVPPERNTPDSEDRVLLNQQRGVPGAERLQVYASGYHARMAEALADVYEAIHRVVGHRAFGALAHRYAIQYPSRHYNLTFFGEQLPTFLKTDGLAARYPFLPDLAHLEWLVCRAFHAVQRPPFDPARLTALSLERWAATRLIFQPSVGVSGSAWPVVEIWQACQQPKGKIQVDLVGRPQQTLVFRQGTQTRCEAIDPLAYHALEHLLQGMTIGALCEALAQQAQAELPLEDWFKRWTVAGLISDCVTA